PAEKNRNLVPLRGVLLANRALWLGLAGVLVAVTWRVFRFQHQPERGGRAGTRDLGVEAADIPTAPTRPPRPLALLPRMAWLAARETVKNVYFLVIVLAGVLFMVATARLAGSIYGTRTYPMTYLMIELAGGGFSLFVLIIITFYSGELVWR